MELLLLKLVVLIRPLASVEYFETLFALLGVGLFGLLVAAVLMRAAAQRSLELSLIDGFIVAFTLWCLTSSVIYSESARMDGVAKLLIPMLSFTLAKNLISDRERYRKVLAWMIVGFAVPVLASAALIAAQSATAVDMVIYWTGVTRWKGAYANAHNMGHSMALLLMALVVFFALRGGRDRRLASYVFLSLLGAIAVWCLYMSQVRSAILGLLVFLAIFGYLQNKKVFLFGAGGFALIAVATLPYWLRVLLHEFAPDRRGGPLDLMELGSGRPAFWLNDITLFASLPIDQKLAGVGIGSEHTVAGEIYGHSDWLRILTDTGAVGFVLFAAINILILRAIIKMHGRERDVFLALFGAVTIMMAVSNSYVWRIQVSQLYYILLAFVQIPAVQVWNERTTMARRETEGRAGSLGFVPSIRRKVGATVPASLIATRMGRSGRL